MSDLPRYFCHGAEYLPPNHYYRVDDASSSVLVQPTTGQEQKIGYPLEYYLQTTEGRGFAETIKQVIDDGMAKWRRYNSPVNL